MTTTPFDDPIAFNRRWGSLDASARTALADSDPLMFLADHLPVADRREGCIAIAVQCGQGPSPLIVIPDGPAHPTDVQCATVIGTAYERLNSDATGLGIVHHRRGGVGITDTDRRWALALRAVCDAFSIEPLGVMARLRSGALVRVPLPDVLPGDYIDGLIA
jgi:hypothetical protein